MSAAEMSRRAREQAARIQREAVMQERRELAALMPLRKAIRGWLRVSLVSTPAIERCQKAALAGDIDALEYYLAGTKAVRAAKAVGWARLQLSTLLHIAAKSEEAPTGMVSLVFRCWPEAAKKTDNTGSTALHYLCQRRGTRERGGKARACDGRCYDEIKLLLDEFPSAASVQDRSLKNPLHYLVKNHGTCVESIQALVSADPTSAAQVDNNSHQSLSVLSRNLCVVPGPGFVRGMAAADAIIRAQELLSAASYIGKSVEAVGASLHDVSFSKRNQFIVGELVAVEMPKYCAPFALTSFAAEYTNLALAQVRHIEHDVGEDEHGYHEQQYLSVKSKETVEGKVGGECGVEKMKSISYPDKMMYAADIGKLRFVRTPDCRRRIEAFAAEKRVPLQLAVDCARRRPISMAPKTMCLDE
jgi:hypothetical protein